MKMMNTGLAALFLAASLTGMAGAKGTSQAAKKASTEVKYKAQCGMIYSAAEAKKNHYVCPMDHKPLKKIVVKKAKGKPAKMSGHKM